MSDLLGFLLARIAQDEAAATDAAGEHWIVSDGDWTAKFLEHVTPARILSECETKRRIVESCDAILTASADKPDDSYEAGIAFGLIAACMALALPYADHADYREEWKP